ncbi:PTS transporter subunit EIIC [Klebsiella variicola]
MSKVIDSLEKVLLPFAVKIGKQPHINAIKNGFIKLMPLTLAGAMFVLINNVFLSFGEGSFFYSMGIRLDASTIETLNGFKAIGGNVYNGTLGIMSLMAPFFIGSALAEERKVDPMAAGLLAVAAFMTVTPYSVGEAYAVGANWLGGQNIISGMIIGLVVAELFTFVIRRNWVIRLPDSVPGSVAKLALPSGIFQINEPILFGLPIIMNPVMFIPFVLVQPILAAITLAAYSLGIIPPVTNLAPWTMPTGLGAFFNSNGSVAALLVALFNLGVATLVYLPFVVLSNKAQTVIEQEESEEDIANALKF